MRKNISNPLLRMEGWSTAFVQEGVTSILNSLIPIYRAGESCQHAPISFQSLNLTVHDDDADDNDDAKNVNLSNSLGLVNFTVRLMDNPSFACPMCK